MSWKTDRCTDRRPMRAIGSMALVLMALVLMACGGGDEEAGNAVASADGVVSVVLPDDFDSAEVAVTIVESLAEPLLAAQQTGLTVHQYELGPDGQQFDQPVTVSFRLDVAALGLDPGQMPFAVMMSGDSDGSFDAYDEVDISLDSKSPMEYSLWLNIEGPSFEAEFSCRHGTGEDAPEGYQDPETLTRSVSLLMLDIDWDEHRTLTGDGTSGSGNWRLVNSSVVGSIRETSYTFSVVR